jgi:hypothetical protein
MRIERSIQSIAPILVAGIPVFVALSRIEAAFCTVSRVNTGRLEALLAAFCTSGKRLGRICQAHGV